MGIQSSPPSAAGGLGLGDMIVRGCHVEITVGHSPNEDGRSNGAAPAMGVIRTTYVPTPRQTEGLRTQVRSASRNQTLHDFIALVDGLT